jgi:hypothetical protein
MNLQVIEHQGQRVLTTQQLAQVYETEPNNIHMNFARNSERFVIGRDYYVLAGDELKEFKNSLPTESQEPLKYAPQLCLWTERGANRHCKILDTDKAWQQFDLLEDTYFKVKTQAQALPQMSQLEIVAAIAQAAAVQEKVIAQIAATQTEQAKQLEIINHRIDSLDLTNIEGTPRQRFTKMIAKYAMDKGIPHNHAWNDFVQSYNLAYSTNLSLRKTNYSGKIGRKISTPEYLEANDQIEDAIRVANIMLNGRGA